MKIKDTQYTVFDIDDIKELNKCSFEECNDAINKVLNEYGKNTYSIYASTIIYIIEKLFLVFLAILILRFIAFFICGIQT